MSKGRFPFGPAVARQDSLLSAAVRYVISQEHDLNTANGVYMNLAAIFGLGPLELIIIIVVIVLLFLPALLPKLAKRLGETVRYVKDMANSKIDEKDDEE